ncbi:hypothetical protein K456DRAFT_35404 [Colletotrichum gloeosporioides 23]|nr:hypothetical protein K456DRAFT_35404 [Colletotrichum gloeosporioides 23]
MYAATEQRREKGGSGTTKRRTGSDGQNKKEWKQGEEAKPGAKRMMGRKWKSWVKREVRYLITVTHLQRGLQEVWKVASEHERQGRRTRPQPGMAKMGNTEAVTDSLGVYEVVQGATGPTWMVHDRAGRGREVDVDVDVESGTSLPLAHRDICFWLERVTGLAGPCPRATPRLTTCLSSRRSPSAIWISHSTTPSLFKLTPHRPYLSSSQGGAASVLPHFVNSASTDT